MNSNEWKERALVFLNRGKSIIETSRPFSGKINDGLHQKGTFGLEQEKQKEIYNIRVGVELLLKGLFIIKGYSVYSKSKFELINNLPPPSESENTIGLVDMQEKLNYLQIDDFNKELLYSELEKDAWLRKKSGDAGHGTLEPCEIPERTISCIRFLLQYLSNIDENLK